LGVVVACGHPQRFSHSVSVLYGGSDESAGPRSSLLFSQRLRHADTCCSQLELVVAQAPSAHAVITAKESKRAKVMARSVAAIGRNQTGARVSLLA
jgi:hypothetical protein